MEIKGLDYNTKREKLLLPEYGREIQKMVDHRSQMFCAVPFVAFLVIDDLRIVAHG